VKLFGLKNCDSCKKAMKALPSAELVDVRTDGVPREILQRALAEFGDAVINTRSTTWRGLSEAERRSEPLALIEAHPTLMKRPLILVGEDLHLGWTKSTQDALVPD